MNNLAIAKQNAPSMDEWQIITQQSQMLIKTGFLPQSIKTPEQALAIILQGRELGIPTMAALGTINVIQGKPTISPQLMLALINRSGQLENIEIKTDSNGCSCTMKRKGRSVHTEYFGASEAGAMNLSGKDNYKKQAAIMYKWRAVAACARTVFPDVILGVYTPDEMGAENVNADGELLQESATIHRTPTKSELIEAAQPKSGIENEIAEICKRLNTSGDSIKWTSKRLNEYICEFFGLENSIDATEEMKEALRDDLQIRLDEIIALQSQDIIEGETENE